MLRHRVLLVFMIVLLVATGCSNQATTNTTQDMTSIGIMLSDVGLGDQSFSDSAFLGLEKARDELNILFDYRELQETGTYEQGLQELVEANHDIVVGLGFMIQGDLEKVAQQFPDQRFVLIDAVSELPNVTSITFKEDEGSFLAGVLAALTSTTQKIGFIGGADVPLIRKFQKGFVAGAQAVNPQIQVISKFANDFGNDKLGAQIAQEMIAAEADVLYAAAGFTGVGVLKQAEASGVYAIGVDSDQFYFAEKAVVSSMLKNIDVALYEIAKELAETNSIPEGQVSFGINENGVGLAPIRVHPTSTTLQTKIDEWTTKLTTGKITIN
ncbi:BMP family ABC transporter substrate-binding protein [Bacillus sp. HMF5848]|uniref:BMP family lipoprotein n=1 Tax=Bacillus sp. HMF5848 TaxID=2495421 RepID=UPI000F7663A0|nr:BMP family ABC transporter substrate-binding protein [Bacillus sp. HMF5848]RSK26432.1 BMP family ABC transporter substrate-binding protein [Bacillus sp. HMF5848]